MKYLYKGYPLLLLVLLNLNACQQEPENKGIAAPPHSRMSSKPYGLTLEEDMKITQASIRKNQSVTTLLGAHLDKEMVKELLAKSAEIFDLRNMKAGNPLTVIKDSAEEVRYMIYEKDPSEYIICDFKYGIRVYSGQRQVTIKRREVAMKVNGSMQKTFKDHKVNPEIMSEMAEVMKWSFDFFKVKKGDIFKVIYDEQLIDGESAGVTRVYAVSFMHDGKEYKAFRFKGEDEKDMYFDEEGKSLKKGFLKAPLKYSRISSGFTNARYHPILHITRPHHGIDYAAPTGTPIMSVGNGTVEEVGSKGGNGNYVKVKHDKTYSTQYLHMSRFAKGIKVGQKVAQGEVIGYVGSTGLATGPHLCFRFWKNGTQINPNALQQEEFRAAEVKDKKSFMAYMNEMTTILDKTEYYNSDEFTTITKAKDVVREKAE